MPIYEYQRPDGSTFEVVQSFEDEPLTEDPQTGEPVRRVLHPPAVHFKGKGFYNTDYGTRKRQREMASSENGSSAKDDSKPKTAAGDGGTSDGGTAAEKPPSAAKDAKSPAAAKTPASKTQPVPAK